ncbi:hypothetical protein [Pseudooctadecabacter sp.]|uniref:hypothetical protein n=1 Tax=Pseudooctadecabacter sp. TaxID=1966338 RepID=UPI0025E50C78|nr:hypothetical protein [Pseudooctadecabacter sp.]
MTHDRRETKKPEDTESNTGEGSHISQPGEFSKRAETVFTNGSELAAQTQQRIDAARDLMRRLGKGSLSNE